MPSDNKNEVRINTVIDREANDLLNQLLPWGAKSDIIRNIVEHLIHDLAHDSDGSFYSALVKKQVCLIIKE